MINIKQSIKRIGIMMLLASMLVFVSGCATSTTAKSIEASSTASTSESSIESSVNNQDVNPDAVTGESEVTTNSLNQEIGSDNPTEESANKYDTIVWLGDSITQGSLGNPDDNLENAPYVRLEEISGLTVEGYGFYGYNTNDIFWVYRDETQKNQRVDNSKLYIFWVGSNDWVQDSGSNTDVGPVMDRIDSFIESGNLKDYIIMGATARIGLREECNGMPLYDIINHELEEHYGEDFLNIQDTITMEGFGPDETHLNQETYDRVARAVYDKLIQMGYID